MPFSRKRDWEALDKLSKEKKRVPLIGFEGFAEICFRAHDKREALKYILKLREDPKANYVLRYAECSAQISRRLDEDAVEEISVFPGRILNIEQPMIPIFSFPDTRTAIFYEEPS